MRHLAEHQHLLALKGLRRVNLLSRTAHIVSTAIYNHWKQDRATLRVLDLACGGGDVTLQVAQLLEQRGVVAEVHGWDRSPQPLSLPGSKRLQSAMQHLDSRWPMRWLTYLAMLLTLFTVRCFYIT